jgi:hypothetical protein
MATIALAFMPETGNYIVLSHCRMYKEYTVNTLHVAATIEAT